MCARVREWGVVSVGACEMPLLCVLFQHHLRMMVIDDRIDWPKSRSHSTHD